MADDSDYADKYPEHAKMMKARDRLDEVARFLEWCEEQNLVLASLDASHAYGLEAEFHDIESTLAAYTGIDPKKISEEKEAMLQEIRFQNEARDTVAIRKELTR